MKKFNLLALVLAVIFAACQSDSDYGALSDTIQRVSVDSSRLIKYSLGSKKSLENLNLSIPSLPQGYKVMDNSFQSSDVKNSDVYVLKTGVTLEKDIQIKNDVEYYIYGNLTITSIKGSNGVIYVMPGGNLTVKEPIINGVEVVNFGELEVPQNFTINKGASIRTASPIVFKDCSIGGVLISKEALNFRKLTLTTGAEVTFGSCAVVEGNIEFANNATVNISSYLKAQNIYLNSAAEIFLSEGSLIQCSKIDISNSSVSIKAGVNKYSLIQTDELIVHHQNQKGFQGKIDIDAKKINNLSGHDIMWLSDIKFEGNTYIESNSCRPQVGQPSEKEYVIEHVAELLAPKKDREVSSTSIDFKGKEAYVSWHTYGDPYDGYIDVLDISSKAEIISSLFAPNTDFNHIYVNNDDIYVTGGTKKGAFVGKVVNSNTSLSFERTDIAGASGNCIIANGEELIAASGSDKGVFSTIKLGEGGYANNINAPYAKYVFRHNDKIVTLNGVLNATISIYPSNGISSAPLKQFSIGQITPENGKNACVSDGVNIFVSMGNTGVKSFTEDGVLVGEYKNIEDSFSVSCVDVDGKYIYLAAGKAGLYILDKQTMKLIKKYKYADASANFVKKGDDGLIYLAYGRAGVHVFRLRQI